MTRAQAPGTEIDYRVVGTPGAARVVVVLRSGSLATIDPDAAETARWDVRLLLIGLDGEELADPPAFGGETPAGSTAQQVLSLVAQEVDGAAFGLVAERATTAFGVSLAADLGERIDRLALVAPAAPDGPLAEDLIGDKLARVAADAIVLEAPDAAATAQWFADRIPAGRAILDAPLPVGDGRLALSAVWPAVLAHVAPGVAHR